MTALLANTEALLPIAQVTRGTVIGTIERRFGMLASVESVGVQAVFERCADLAVADRFAYLGAAEQAGQQLAVVQAGGWYWVVELDCTYAVERFAELRSEPGAPRLMSVATAHGIVPQLIA